MGDADLHVIPGEYYHNGVLYVSYFSMENMQRVRALETSSDDLVIVSYPKTGTTWAQQIVSGIYPENCPKEKNISFNIPFAEMSLPPVFGADAMKHASGIELIESRPSPRLMKSHLQGSFFEERLRAGNLKIILMVRNFKDMVVSYYHHYRCYKATAFSGSFDEFMRLVKAKKLVFGDFIDFYKTYSDLWDLPNVLVVRYEDLKTNIKQEVARIAKFCGRNLDKESLAEVAGDASFEAMRGNENADPNFFLEMNIGSRFHRKGVNGDWKSHMTKEQSDYFDGRLRDEFPEYRSLYPDDTY